MSSLKLSGNTSGFVELSAGEIAENNTITLPGDATKLVVEDSGGDVNVSGVLSATGFNGVAYAGITTTATSKTLVNREYCTVVSPSQTITLPASPQPGWEVGIAVNGSFDNTIVARNGSNIMGLAENMTLDRSYASVQLVYSGAVIGWRVF